MRKILSICVLTLALLIGLAAESIAAPDTAFMRVTDVTPASFCVVWMTDVAANPTVEVYEDSSMTTRITDGITITPMPAGSTEAAQAAQGKGIMKVRVSGLSASTGYYFRAVTQDPSNPADVGYSAIQQVTSTATVTPFYVAGGSAQPFSNDLAAFKVYARPSVTGDNPRLGDLIVFDVAGSPYPVSAFVGDGTVSPEGILDLNNIFGASGISLGLTGGERIVITVYRGEALGLLTHYRLVAVNENVTTITEPSKGFFADINLDGVVDDKDFTSFKDHYRTSPDDATYNPDFNFIDDSAGIIDARDFSKFSKEYGDTNVRQ